MDSDQFGDEVEGIFAAAVHLAGSERATLLDVRCAGRADLRAELESLLSAHDRAGRFIQPVTLAGDREVAFAVSSRARIGERVGAFRLVEVLGEGGMGTVFRAERADGQFTQQVAIKFIGSWIRDPVAASRFRAERQILASLRHPNIVSLVDGGVTADGQAYLVMEYVDGQPITTYCHAGAQSLENRLRLFNAVCGAVQFAHAHLIVHRDLKPANIIVTADGVPKVLDFGIAKLLGPSVERDATLTGLFPGPLTPNYASPEQLRGLPVTTACDVYTLGVLLYELLTGTRPYEVIGKPVDQVLALVLETDPPAASTARARNQGAAPFRAHLLSGDLDAIVMKALQKEPARRYTSAADLADDVTRYLEGRTVLARPDRVAYRAGKFVRRHRVAVAGAAAAALSLVVGLGVALWQAEAARIERDRAQMETAKAQQVSQFLGELFTSNAPRQNLGRTLTAQDLLENGVQRIDSALAGQPELQASMLATLGSVYTEMGLGTQALPLLERSLAMREQLFGGDHVDVAESLRLVGRVRNRLSLDYAKAEAVLKRAVAMRERLAGHDDLSLSPTLSELGLVLWRRGQFEEGRSSLRRAVAIGETGNSPDLQKWLSNLSLLEKELGDFDSAEKLLRRALELGVKAEGRGIPVDVTMLNLGTLLRAQEHFEEARGLLEEVKAVHEKTWGEGNVYTWGALGNLYLGMGDYPRARDFLDQAIVIAGKRADPEPIELAPPLTFSGRLFLAEGKPHEALAALERSLRIRERLLGKKHNDVAETLVDIARAKAALDGPAAAEPLLRRALAMQRETLVAGHRYLVPTLTELAEMLLARGAAAEAQTLLREAADIARSRLPGHHSHRLRVEAVLERASR